MMKNLPIALYKALRNRPNMISALKSFHFILKYWLYFDTKCFHGFFLFCAIKKYLEIWILINSKHNEKVVSVSGLVAALSALLVTAVWNQEKINVINNQQNTHSVCSYWLKFSEKRQILLQNSLKIQHWIHVLLSKF